MQASATSFFADQDGSSINLFAILGAHLVFGGTLFYGTQKFFEEVEKKLNDPTKLEIAIWLLDLRPTRTVQGWRSTFLKIFNRVFGEKHWSWKCFWRSSVTSAIIAMIAILGVRLAFSRQFDFANPKAWTFIAWSISGSVLPDYISLWKTRRLIWLSQTTQSAGLHFVFFIVDCILSFICAICAACLGEALLISASAGARYGPYIMLSHPLLWLVAGWDFLIKHWHDPLVFPAVVVNWFIPAFFGRLWLLSYVLCGLLLKFARRLDIGFAWFNRRFDVENHPLQCIGLVAGTFCAIGYWILAGIHLIR